MTLPHAGPGLKYHALIALGLALILYVGSYSVDGYLRRRHGPWSVTFTRETNGAPALIINQPKLNIHGVKIVFLEEPTVPASQTVVFDQPLRAVPFGKLKFEDLTYLPGTITLDIFGHEIELLPRVLIVNRREYSWDWPGAIPLRPADKLPPAREKR